MRICSTARIARAMALAGFFLVPVVSWGEAGGASGEDLTPLPLSWSNPEKNYSLDMFASSASVKMYGNSLALSRSLTEASMSSGTSTRDPDWDGLTSDTAHFLGYQLSIIGILYVMPASISGWTDETKSDFSMQQYRDNVSRIVWDKDDWWINYVLHPYWGGTYYVRAQERGFGPVGSFWYSVALSSLYEFGAEAFFEEPSIQDLIVTPVAGYFVGQYFAEVRANIREKKKSGSLSGRDKFVMVMTDPIGAMNAKVDSWFGRETNASLSLMLGPQFRTPVVSETRFEQSRQMNYIGTSDFGVKMSLRW